MCTSATGIGMDCEVAIREGRRGFEYCKEVDLPGGGGGCSWRQKIPD